MFSRVVSFIGKLTASPSGFGSAGIRRQRICGAITIVKAAADTAAFQQGVALDEGGINIEEFQVRYFLEVNSRIQDLKGETRVRARSTKVSRDITLRGEVIGALTAYPLNTASTVNNAVNTFGDGTGLILFDEGTETQNRSAARKVEIKLSSNPGLVA